MDNRKFVWGDPEEEMKRRMALARQQGYSDDEIQRSAMIQRAVDFNSKQQQQMSDAQKKRDAQGAGRAGGLKGFALDITPFGRIAEKLINHNAGDITAGEVGTEAALTLLPFGLGKIAKGAKLAKGVITGVKDAEDAAKISKGTRFANALTSRGTIAGTSTIDKASDQQALIKLVQENPKLAGSAHNKFHNAEGVLDEMSNSVDDLFAGVPNKVSTPDFMSKIHAVRQEIVDPNELKRFDIEMNRAMQSTFGKQAPRINGATADAGRSQAAAIDMNTPMKPSDFKVYQLRNKQGTPEQMAAWKKQADATEFSNKAEDDLIKAGSGMPGAMPGHRLGDSANNTKTLGEWLGKSGKASPNAVPDKVENLFGEGAKTDFNATDVNAVRRQVNKSMSGIYKKIEAGTTLTDKDQALLRLKSSLDDQLTELAPEAIRGQVKTLNGNMNTLIKGIPEFKKASETGGSMGPLGNLFGVGPMVNQAMQSTADRAVRVGQKVITQPVRTAGQQAGVRIGADAMGFRDPFQQDGNSTDPFAGIQMTPYENPADDQQSLTNQLAGTGSTNFDELASALDSQQGGGSDQSGVGGYSSADLTNAAIEAAKAGDSKSSDQLLQLADAVAKQEKLQASSAGGGLGNVGKVSAQNFNLATDGASSIQQITAALQKDPGLATKTSVPGQGLPVVGGYVSAALGTNDYQSLAYNIADKYLKLTTGATATKSEILNTVGKLMPQAGDDPQEAQRKIQRMSDFFNRYVQTAQQTGGAGDDFESQLAAMMGGGASTGYGY